MKIGIGYSTEKDPTRAAQEALRVALVNLHTEKISLAILFTTIEFARGDVAKPISKLLGQTPILGCSSLGVILNQGIFKHAVAIALLSFPESIYFNTACVKEISAKTGTLAGEELGEKLTYGFKNIRRDLSMIFSDGLMRDGSGFLWGLQEILGTSFPLIGATASANLMFKDSYVYSNGESVNDAASGIIWGGRLNFGLGVKHGWKPLGKPRKITKSAGNTVYEIDGSPAANIYKEYLACDLYKLRQEFKRISILYPIGVYLPGEDEYLLRNLVSIEESGALVFQGNMPLDASVRLMIGTKESCLAATHQALAEMKQGLLGRPIDFVLVFDSISRYILLGRLAFKEIEIIKEELGDSVPLMGIYTYGEQAPLRAINYQGRSYFHNQTLAILGIGG